MQLAAAQAGLRLEGTRIVTSSEWILYQCIHLLLYPRMDEPSKFWSRNAELSLREKVVLKLVPMLHRTKVTHLTTRVFDAMRIGDD